MRDAVATAWSDMWDRGDYDTFRALTDEGYRRSGSGIAHSVTLEEFLAEVTDVRAAFPDLVTQIDDILMDGDELAIFWTSEGTFANPLGTVPPTGRRVRTHGSNRVSTRAGRIRAEQVTWDANELLRSIGLPSLHYAFDDIVDEAPDGSPAAHRDMLKAFNKQFVSGVTVVTTRDEIGAPRGLAVSAYTSVSLDPPLVLVCVQKTSGTYPLLFRTDHFGVNILSSEQGRTLATFASKAPDKFADIPWHPGPHGSPLIEGSSAAMEVEIKERFQALTHTILIGRVRHAETTDDAPILYKAGKFYDGRTLTELPPSVTASPTEGEHR